MNGQLHDPSALTTTKQTPVQTV